MITTARNKTLPLYRQDRQLSKKSAFLAIPLTQTAANKTTPTYTQSLTFSLLFSSSGEAERIRNFDLCHSNIAVKKSKKTNLIKLDVKTYKKL